MLDQRCEEMETDKRVDNGEICCYTKMRASRRRLPTKWVENVERKGKLVKICITEQYTCVIWERILFYE
ncbi:hypothetical protein Hanom_Chr14g01257681 [Helianthus anomalus]